MIYDDAIQTLADLPRVQANRIPQHPALIWQTRSLTYQQLHSRSNQLAHALHQQGIQAGTRVALLAKDSLQSYEILFACAKIGAVFVPLNWRLTAPEIAYILHNAEVELLFVGAASAKLVELIQPELPKIQTIVAVEPIAFPWINYEDWVQNQSSADLENSVKSTDVAVKLYTSGTTGHPKGVLLGHYSFFAIAQAFAQHHQRWIGWNHQDRSLLALPIFHIGGLWWAIRGLVAGATTILLESFIPADALSEIATHKITKTCLVPAMIQSMLAEPSCRTIDFAALETIVYGGSPIAESLLQQALEVFGCQFVQIYGMTETGNCAVSLAASDHLATDSKRLQAAGKAFPGVEIAVLNSQQEPLPAGAIGEICLKSPANMIGYWHLPDATASTLINGWIHTGDAGYLDAEGYLYICDRIKDMICYASENVYPAEVENVLYQHPAIAEVAVIGVPDRQWGETVKALIVLKPGMTAKPLELINFARGKIANYKLPRSVEFVESLPRTPSGKLQKGKLRAPYWQGYSRQVN